MFETALATHQNTLATLAKDWLASGATAFSIWSGGIPLVGWPKNADYHGESIAVEIRVEDNLVGELRVSGINSPAAWERLRTEAGLISLNLALSSLQAEMEMARRVQISLLPKEPPCVKGLNLWAAFRPASHVSGDFYDFMANSGQPFTFVIGDISGKGMPAALLMSMTRTVIREQVNTLPVHTPEMILLRSNEKLYQDFSEAGMFVTAFIGQYDSSCHELRYANAGHSPVIYCPKGGNARLLEADGTALGVLPESFSGNQCLRLSEGDVLVAATDGFNEARNPQGRRFGYDRLLNSVEALAYLPAQDIAEGLSKEVQNYRAGEPQEDDQTIVVLRFVGP